MNNKVCTPSLYKVAIIALMAGLASCSSGTPKSAQGEETSENTNADKITLTATQFTNGQMELGNITAQQFETRVKANGRFDVPPENKTTINTYFSGYIKSLTLLPGEPIKKGQVLFILENPEYVQVQQNFLEAQGRLNYLKSDYERQKTLMEDEVTSQKNFLKAESDYKVTLAQYQSLKKQLALMNINTNTLSADNLQSTIAILAPLSGFVTSIPVAQGMFLNPSDEAMTITNMEDMHFELKVYEKDLPLLKEGQTIRGKLQNGAQKEIIGEIHFINKAINPADRSIDIHGDLLHPEDVKRITPGMYVEAEIITETVTYPALPKDAVAQIENNYYVLIKQDDTTFQRKSVDVGVSNESYVQIRNVDDFDADTQFLTKGVFNLITE